MMRVRELIVLLIFLLSGCSVGKNPAAFALNERGVRFKVVPYIERRDGYHLVYQIEADTVYEVLNRVVIGSGVFNQRGCFYFVGKTSFREYGLLKRVSISEDEPVMAYVKQDSVFWLNPDGSTVKLLMK